MLYLCTVEMMVEDFTGMRRKIYCSEEEKYLLRREKITAPKRKNRPACEGQWIGQSNLVERKPEVNRSNRLFNLR